jgi:hypothetical protein
MEEIMVDIASIQKIMLLLQPERDDRVSVNTMRQELTGCCCISLTHSAVYL